MKKLIVPEYPGKQLKKIAVAFALAFIVFSIAIIFIKPSITGLYIYENNTDVNPASGNDYNSSLTYQFNITIDTNDTIDTVWIEHNFTGSFDNYTSNITNIGNIYTYEYLGLAAGNYTYLWHFNNTIGEFNSSIVYNYSVEKANPGLNWLVLPFPGPNIDFGITTNVSCLANNNQTNISLYRNSTYIDSSTNGIVSDVQTLSAGSYLYTCNTTGSQNFTNSSTIFPLTIDPVTPNLTLTFNGTPATNTTNLTLYVPGTVEICLNVTPYSPGANLTIEENKNGTWVVLLNTTNSTGYICYNRTFQNTTDPQYAGTATLALGSSDWDSPGYDTPESGSIVITPTNPPAPPPGGGGGGPSCTHQCPAVGETKDLNAETYLECQYTGACRDWVVKRRPVVTEPEPIPPVIEIPRPEGKLEISEPTTIQPCVQGKLIPAEQGCRYECLSESRIKQLSNNLVKNNELTGAFVFENGYEVLYGFPSGENDIEIQLIKKGSYQGNSWLLSVFSSDKALWAQNLNFNTNQRVLTGMRITCDENVNPDKIRLSLINQDRLITFIEKDLPQQHLEAVVQYSNNRFTVLDSSVQPGPAPENPVGPYVWAVYDSNSQIIKTGLFAMEDAIFQINNQLERKPLEGSVATVYLPWSEKAERFEINDATSDTSGGGVSVPVDKKKEYNPHEICDCEVWKWATFYCENGWTSTEGKTFKPTVSSKNGEVDATQEIFFHKGAVELRQEIPEELEADYQGVVQYQDDIFGTCRTERHFQWGPPCNEEDCDRWCEDESYSTQLESDIYKLYWNELAKRCNSKSGYAWKLPGLEDWWPVLENFDYEATCVSYLELE